MRHGKTIKHLSRTASHRRALMANMASSLVIADKKRIITTLAKAKALRKYLEPLVTKARTNTTHSRRVVFSYLNDKNAVNELFTTVAPKIGDRQGGYLRILKLGPRKSDATEMALIEFVDFNQFTTAEPAKKKTSRKRRAAASKKGAATKKAATKTKAKAKAKEETDTEAGEE